MIITVVVTNELSKVFGTLVYESFYDCIQHCKMLEASGIPFILEAKNEVEK